MRGFTEGIVGTAIIGVFVAIAYIDCILAGLLVGVALVAVGMNTMMED